MKYLRLIRVNLTRKKTRLILTLGSFAVALFLYGLLVSIHNAFYQGVDAAGADRLIVRNKTSLIMLVPYGHKEKIKQIPGVRAITSGTWFGGVYQDPKNFFAQYAIEPEQYLEIYPEFIVPEEQWEAFLEDRQGCIVGSTLAEQFKWKLGDRIPLKGTIFPGVWEFNIRGIYEGAREKDDTSQFWFQYKYIEEMSRWVKGNVGWYMVKVKDPDDSLKLSEAIDKRFANSPNETKTEPEALFVAGFVKQFGNIKLLLVSVGAVVFFTLLLIAGSTMAMSVRERTGEIAVLKALGFSDLLVLVLVLGESLIYALIGGGLGILSAKLFTMGGDPTKGLLPNFNFSTFNIVVGLVVIFLIGVISGLVPALNAMRLRVVDALRRI